MMQRINRIQPRMPAEHMTTFSVSAPKATHWRAAACAEVECDGRRNGWVTFVDEATDLGQGQAHYIRKESGRRFVESKEQDGRTQFAFPADQECFADHQVPIGRPELYIVRNGDWRGNPRGEVLKHTRPELWVEHMSGQLDTIKAIQDRA